MDNTKVFIGAILHSTLNNKAYWATKVFVRRIRNRRTSGLIFPRDRDQTQYVGLTGLRPRTKISKGRTFGECSARTKRTKRTDERPPPVRWSVQALVGVGCLESERSRKQLPSDWALWVRKS